MLASCSEDYDNDYYGKAVVVATYLTYLNECSIVCIVCVMRRVDLWVAQSVALWIGRTGLLQCQKPLMKTLAAGENSQPLESERRSKQKV